MADALTVYEGSPDGTSEVTVATIAAGKALIMQGYRISNSNAAEQTVTLKIGTDTIIIPAHKIPANDAIQERDLNIPVLAGKTIKITAGVADDIDYYIYGILIDV
jgi:hypothetical protein